MTRLLLCLAVLAVAALTAAPVYAQSEAELRQIDRRWNREWREFAKFFVVLEGQYYCFPGYDPERPSSHAMTAEEYIRHTAYEFIYRTQDSDNNRAVVTKPIEEAQAATLLIYDPLPGAYGFIHSGEIVHIEEQRSIDLKHVHLVDWDQLLAEKADRQAWVQDFVREHLPAGKRDAEGRLLDPLLESLRIARDFRFEDRQRAYEIQTDEQFAQLTWRIAGVSTDDCVAGQRWPAGEEAGRGLHLVILSVQDDLVTAVPPDWIGKDISELDVLNALEQFGYSKTTFIELVNLTRREHRDDYVQFVLDTIVQTHADRDDAEPAE